MPILAYHMVDPRFTVGLTRVRPQQFERQIRLLVEYKFDIVTISDYLLSTDQQKQIAITFDDGYESVYTHALPVLEKYGVPASVFVNPAFVGQYNTWDANLGWRCAHMDWKQIDALHERGWEVGSHGMSHRDLSRLPEKTVEEELEKSCALIKNRLGVCSPVLSFPFGNVNDIVVMAAEKTGYKFGLSMGMLKKNIPLHFKINRTGIYLLDNLIYFKLKAFSKCTLLFYGMQTILGMCSDVTVAIKARNWSFY